MPKSANQRTLACIALAIKEGKTPASYSAEAAKMAESMTEEKLTEWCKGPIEKK